MWMIFVSPLGLIRTGSNSKLVTGGDDRIGLVEAEVHIVMAHEADGAEREPMVVGHNALAVERRRHGNVERFGEPAYRFSRAAAGRP